MMMEKKMLQKGTQVIQLLVEEEGKEEEEEEEEEEKYFWCSDISHKSCCTLPQVSLLYECKAVSF
jgi:hypothetical protein